ncbi:MAG: LicD family protein [Prevotellaceae bacterium]|nr:LicD family protein [Prevotella sp.]MDD7257860.1 LicD family protein [Prevotellaceae bacterium]MDY6130564.1 LicD family protein [Prevotella sp.]
MKRITDIHELRQIQVGILDDIHRFCTEQDIQYFLSSGTLIGAVRHGGYIPWDDDLDLYMPRKDYERFMASYQDEKGIYRVLNPKTEKNYYYTFGKVVDTRTRMVETETAGFEIGVYVDVFPVDYVTDNLEERQRIFKRKRLLYKIRRCKISKENPLKSRLAYLCYKYLPLSLAAVNRKIERLVVNATSTTTVCNMSEAGPSIKGCFPAQNIASAVDIIFEGKTYKTMVGYKEYLSHTYGNYMQLPPVEQRVTHSFEAYWKD